MASCSCVCCGEGAVVQVAAGPHDRRDVIVSTICADDCECGGSHVLAEIDDSGAETGLRIVGQCDCGCDCGCVDDCDCGGLTFIVPEMKAGETKRFKVTAGCAGEDTVCMADNGATVDISVGGELFTTWHGGPNVVRPYCYPIIGPGGVKMTREISDDRSKMDHIHHKSMYTAQGDVNGVDNWSEEPGHGFSRNVDKWATSGPVYGQLWTINDWTDAGGKPLLREYCRIRVYNTPSSARVMDWLIIWSAEYGGVFFGDTKEAGTLSVRLTEELNADGKGTGTIVNGVGGIGEEECWGKRAPWVDYSGSLGDQSCGLAIFDHPDNYDYPTTWHVRSYGLFTVNQWGKHDFSGDWADRGDLALTAGDALTFNFRVYIHDGDVCSANVKGKWLDFAFPPKAGS